jgi:drug/metabolite transporter (DMT)-like permease
VTEASLRTDVDPRLLRRARIAIAVGVVAIAFAAIFFRRTAPTPPLVAAGLRLVLASLLFTPFAARHFRTLSPAIWRDAALGGLCYALHFGAWVTSLALTTVAASVTLVTATPLLLAIVAFATKRDRPTPRQLLAIPVALVGTAMLGGSDAFSSDALLGDALAFVGAIAMAGYLLLVRRHGDALPVLAFATIACGTGGVVLLGTAAAVGLPLVPPTAEAALFVVLATLLPQLVGHTALTWALRHVPPTTIGLATVAEPVGATLLAWLWLHEVPSALALAGCAVTLASVLLAFRRTSA